MKIYLAFLILFTVMTACSDEEEVLQIETHEVVKNGGCEQVLTCFETCAENASCIERCIQTQKAEASSKAVGVALCLDLARKDCFTDACRLDACSGYIDICFDDVQYNCGQVMDCRKKCLDNDCEGRCSDLATKEAKSKLDKIFVCFGECSDDPECVDRRCWDEISVCRN